ncbi:hypothetical protein Leryth_017061, partial [Lithospermum erythrorhizon]
QCYLNKFQLKQNIYNNIPSKRIRGITKINNQFIYFKTPNKHSSTPINS